MSEFLVAAYPWMKSLHVISVIAWMAGMFYLPRLFVYHCNAEVGSTQSETFKVMERRLLRAIINPAMLAAWLFGAILAFSPGVVDWTAGWAYIKLAAVVLLSGYHGYLARWRKDFESDQNRNSEKFYRVMNEVPTVLMIVIVIMVIVQPF